MTAAEPTGSTIAAVATGPARGGVAVVRISGPRAKAATLPLAPNVPEHPVARLAYLSAIRERGGALLDEALYLFFPAPHSYTGEDVVELQLHGSPALASLVLAQVLADGGVRAAGPGEFTRRAFLNGRIDLLRAEAVMSLVAAESEAGVRAAARQLHGALSEAVREVTVATREVAADVEGVLAFPEEADGADDGIGERLGRLLGAVSALVEQAARGRRVRRGARVVLVGPVNAGKSTLFNALLAEERALTDETPGTTRDVLEAPLDLDGLPVTLVDTAGLRPTTQRLEARGIEKTYQALEGADLAVWVDTAVQVGAFMTPGFENVEWLRVTSKSDLQSQPSSKDVLTVSAVTGAGLDALRAAVRERLWGAGQVEATGSFSDRSEGKLKEAAQALASAVAASATSTLEVVAGELGLALEALEAVTGGSATESVVDAVFRRFCIGK